MSVVGFDFGDESCVIAVAKQNQIDVVLDNESHHEIPAIVCFGDNQRFIGKAGAAYATMNPKSTISQIRRLIGRPFSDPELQRDLRSLPFTVTEGLDGFPLIHVRYLGDNRTFTPTQVLGMLFSYLKGIAEEHLNSPVVDCCIGIPVYFTDLQRRAVLDAATIAGLHPQRLIHETTAIALADGFSIIGLLVHDPINIVFVNIGYSSIQVCVASFKEGQLKILAHSFDRNLGGRDFDEVLFQHFVSKFIEEYTVDVFQNGRACFRLRSACKKLRKVLSANPEATLNIEGLMDDKDVRGFMKREEFEQISISILKRVKRPLEKAVADAQLKVENIHTVKLVGSASRVPGISKILIELFGKEPRLPANARECVAKGCAAILSPTFKDREFKVIDSFPFSISMSLKCDTPENQSKVQESALVLPKGSPMQCLKVITIYQLGAVTVDLQYSDVSEFPGQPKISTYMIRPSQSAIGDHTDLKFIVRLNLHGIVSIDSVTGDDPETKDNVSEVVYGALSQAELQRAMEKELEMAHQDRLMEQIKLREDAFGSVHDMRNKRNDKHYEFVIPSTSFSQFSFSDLEKATNYFDPSLKIGEGGDKSMYRGFLCHTEVAIRILRPDIQDPGEFQQEVDALSKLRHPNIVTLIGACPESGALIYEYLHHGSLEDRLNCKNNSVPLPWQTRIRIAAELCSVLIFLHSSQPKGTILGVLNPTNILLDSNFVCKLIDFSTCHLSSTGETTMEKTMRLLTSKPKGTFSYMDPEFLATGELTTKSDVYSFGVILLRLLTGKPVLGIARMVRYALDTGKFNTILDPSAGDWPFIQAEVVARMGLRCCEMNRRNRPDFTPQVWRVLEPMKALCHGFSSLQGVGVNQENLTNILYNEELRQNRGIEEELRKGKEELKHAQSQQDKLSWKLDEAIDENKSLQRETEELRFTIKELEEKIISAVDLLQKYKEERDAFELQRDSALQEAEHMRSELANGPSNSNIHVSSLFSSLDLERATNNFDPSLKLGEGGYGIIYKGFLCHTEVAIKIIHQDSMQRLEEFQQEVNILSKLRHPNVVTLIGTCPEFRALIYEYLHGGSLEDRLNCKDNKPSLPWQIRIQIATELCSVLIFLHSIQPYSVVHGDLRPSNILLDDNFGCKLTNFGISRLISTEQTARFFTTEPKGTFSYTDPEFLATGELTTKSDVYSFGVILFRLLTGKSALGIAKEVKYALENGNLNNILDTSAGDWPFVQAQQLAHMGLRCCEMNQRNRPDLASDVWRVLEPIKASCQKFSSIGRASDEHAPFYFICPILQETMQDPHIASDGFTYESEAIRGWLDSGHDTSPMTNVTLENHNLVPNRALRSVIQEWLQHNRLV